MGDAAAALVPLDGVGSLHVLYAVCTPSPTHCGTGPHNLPVKESRLSPPSEITSSVDDARPCDIDAFVDPPPAPVTAAAAAAGDDDEDKDEADDDDDDDEKPWLASYFGGRPRPTLSSSAAADSDDDDDEEEEGGDGVPSDSSYASVQPSSPATTASSASVRAPAPNSSSSASSSASRQSKRGRDSSSASSAAAARRKPSSSSVSAPHNSCFFDPSNNFFKGIKWSPDGLCVLTCNDDNALRLFEVPMHAMHGGNGSGITSGTGGGARECPCGGGGGGAEISRRRTAAICTRECRLRWPPPPSLPDDGASGSGAASSSSSSSSSSSQIAPWRRAALCVREGETVYDFAWFPLMNSNFPATCCFASTSRDAPVHLWDAFTGQVAPSYNSVTVYGLSIVFFSLLSLFFWMAMCHEALNWGRIPCPSVSIFPDHHMCIRIPAFES